MSWFWLAVTVFWLVSFVLDIAIGGNGHYPGLMAMASLIMCELSQIEKRLQGQASEAWNTRWERTCKPIRKGTSVSCDVCGSELHDPYRFCGGCGAKVVDE